MAENVPQMSHFEWTEEKSAAAIALAQGKTHQEVADEAGIDRRTISRWLRDMDFAAEVDRLTLMVDVSSRAERLRIAMRVIRQRMKGNEIETSKDLLEWLKFAQSETDGIKLDLPGYAASFAKDEAPVATSGPTPKPDYPN